jgi:hypothetical protein
VKKNSYFNHLVITMALLSITPAHGMNQKRGADLVASISAKINTLKKTHTKTSDVEEVFSPEIQKEHQQVLQSIMKDAQQLNALKNLSSNERVALQQAQSLLLDPAAKNALKQTIADTITRSWQQYGKAIAQAAIGIVAAGVSTAAIGLVTQGIKIGTGNLLALDSNTLLVTGLTSTAYAAITALSQSRVIASTSSGALSEALIIPFLASKSYTITIPSASGPITSWITNEATEIATRMVEGSGGIGKMLGSINLAQTLLPTPNRQLGTPSNELVSAALPSVRTIVGNQKIASVLTEIGWIVMQSAAVGGTLYMAGFGYAGSTLTESINYAILTGVAQGTLASVITFGRVVSPGAIINIASAPLAQQALVIAGGTPQGAATAVIQATVTEVSNVLMNESKKYGGLLPSLQKGKELLGQAISSRWSSTWTAISDAWETIQSIEPLPM